MRTKHRVGTVVLAGTLLCTLGMGSLALADAPAAPASTAIEMVPAAAQGVQLATKQVGTVQLQVGADWTDITEVMGLTGMGAAFQCDYGQVTVNTSAMPEGADGTDPATIDTITDGFMTELKSTMPEGAVLGTAEDRYVDGALVRTIQLSWEDQGVMSNGYVVFVMQASEMTQISAMFVLDAAPDAAYLFEQINRSITIVPAATAATDAPAATETPAAAGTETPAPAAASAEGAIELPGWTIVPNTAPEAIIRTAIAEDYWDDDVAGRAVIGIPVTVTNTGEEADQPLFDVTVTCYGPTGIEQSSNPGWVFDDSFGNLTKMRPGATTNAVVYMFDEGAGTYPVAFSSFDADYNTITSEVEITI